MVNSFLNIQTTGTLFITKNKAIKTWKYMKNLNVLICCWWKKLIWNALHIVWFQLCHSGNGKTNYEHNEKFSGCQSDFGRQQGGKMNRQSIKDFEGSENIVWYYNDGYKSLYIFQLQGLNPKG